MVGGSRASLDQGSLLLVHALQARPLRQNSNRAAPSERWPNRARPGDQRLKTFVTLGQPSSEPLHDLITQRAVPPDQGRQPGTELKIERFLFAPYRVDRVQTRPPFRSPFLKALEDSVSATR